MPLRFSMLLLAGLAAALIVVSLVSVWQTRTLHEAELKRQLAADAAAPRGAVVLLGDSIFEGLDTTALTPGALNFGIGGDTSRGLLDRISRYSSLTAARAIFLEIGINDLLHSTRDDVVANYRRILAALPNQPRLYLIGILPIDERAFVAACGDLASNATIARLNLGIRELCLRRDNCVHLQPFGGGALLPAYHNGDGVHLSEAGYGALETAIKAALAEPSTKAERAELTPR